MFRRFDREDTKTMSTPREPAERRSNLELYRIITMLFIIAHHYVVHSGLRGLGPVAEDPLSFHSMFILVFGAWGKTGINCFILITGYFMCTRNITLKKFLKLFCEIMFYMILVVILIEATGYQHLSFSEVLSYLLPIRDLNTDFYCGFLVFYLFIPFLNILVRHMGERTHVRLLALLSFAYIFLGTVPGFSVTMNNSVWFIVLYFIASYIRLYPKKLFSNRRFWGIATLACIFVSALSVVLCTRFGVASGRGISSSWHFVMDSNTLLAVLTALSSFMYFNNLNIPRSRIINTIASTTFGVLLIHANGAATARWLWTDLLHTVESHATAFGYLHALLCVPLVFAAASCIDLLRIRFIERPFFKVLDKKLPGITATWRRLEERFFEKCHIS